MSNPQLENGYTKIADEILDKFCSFRIPGEVRQIVDCIMRKTYGFCKKEDKISGSQFVKMTGLKRQNIYRASSKAITHKLVIKTDDKWRLNKNTKEWISFELSSKRITNNLSSKVITPVIQSDYNLSSKVMHTKDNKDNIQKREYLLKKYLKNIPLGDRQEIMQISCATDEQIIRKGDDLFDWIESKGKRYKNYKALLRNAIKRDYPKKPKFEVYKLASTGA